MASSMAEPEDGPDDESTEAPVAVFQLETEPGDGAAAVIGAAGVSICRVRFSGVT